MTDDLGARLDRYMTALGWFVHEFAESEKAIRILLCVYAGVGLDVGRAIFSGTRVDAAKGLIGRLMDLREIPEADRAEVLDALGQLGQITSARNDILHHGTALGGKMFVSNWMSAHIPERERKFPISADTLHDMRMDLKEINWRLTEHATWLANGGSLPPGFPRPPRQSWRYKPVQAPVTKKNRKASNIKE